MINYVFYFIFSLILSLIITPLIIRFSKNHNIVDKPNERKIHTRPTSRLGGFAIFLSFIIPFAIINIINNKIFDLKFNIYIYTLSLFLSFLLGLTDDLINIRARYKLIAQIVIAFIASLSGLQITQFSFFSIFTLYFGYFSYILTILWIITFMNATNLIDGMDGLASGIIAIATAFLFVISLLMKNLPVSYISIILLGSIIGFYIFNFPPAKIFMGDGGAYFLGFTYATLGLMGLKKSSVALIYIIPIVLLLLPILDAIRVSIKRIKEKKGIFIADRNHLHHRLLDLGFTTKNILFILYLFTFILGIFSLLLVLLPKEYSFSLFILIFLVTFFSFYLLYIFEKKISIIKNKNKKR